jgi:uncharacterized protein
VSSDQIAPQADGSSSQPPRLAPISAGERITLIDALRGFALAGVLLANLTWFTGYQRLPLERALEFPTAEVDRIVVLLIWFFVDGKFITLFSFLFGLGFAVQLMRAEERGVGIRPVYLRRMGVLFLFGALHLFLLWHGDILMVYALMGFLMVLFVRRSDRFLLIWGFVLGGVLSLLLILAFFILMGPEALGGAERETFNLHMFKAFTEGNYAQAVRANVRDFFSILGKMLIFLFPFVLGRFLLGFWAGRKGLFHDPEGNRLLLEKIQRWGGWAGLVIWLVLTGLMAAALYELIPEESPWFMLLALMGLGSIFLAAFYASTFALLYLDPKWKRRLDVLAPVGRMALTNYLGQSLVSVLVFWGWGLGLAGRYDIGPTIYLVYWILLFTLQVIFSQWWLARYRFGPFEWIWRSMTYRKWQPMRL